MIHKAILLTRLFMLRVDAVRQTTNAQGSSDHVLICQQRSGYQKYCQMVQNDQQFKSCKAQDIKYRTYGIVKPFPTVIYTMCPTQGDQLS